MFLHQDIMTGFLEQALSQSSAGSGYIHTIVPLDIYQKPGDKSLKQTTWRITLSHPERTLTTEEVNKLLDVVADEAGKKFKAERI